MDNIQIINARTNNLKNISIEIPINSIIGVYGKSGSGKSSLLLELNVHIKNSIYINQKPIRGNNISIIATYIGIFDEIREELGNLFKINKNNYSQKYAPSFM